VFPKIAFTRKHQETRRKWIIPDNFPDPRIAQSFLNPKIVLNSPEKFLWQLPSKEQIVSYGRTTLRWSDVEVRVFEWLFPLFILFHFRSRLKSFLFYKNSTLMRS
jgi:hypothetical protein